MRFLHSQIEPEEGSKQAVLLTASAPGVLSQTSHEAATESGFTDVFNRILSVFDVARWEQALQRNEEVAKSHKKHI